MPPRSKKDLTVIILDVGRTANQAAPDVQSFLEASIESALMILQRMIFSGKNDEVSIILNGTEGTANNLASEDEGNYENITIASELIQPNWNLVRTIKDIKGTDVEGDWLDGLIVSLDFLKDATEQLEPDSSKLVIFSSFGGSSSSDELDIIAQGINKLGTELTIIHPDFPDLDDGPDNDDYHDINQPSTSTARHNQNKPSTSAQRQGMSQAKQLAEKTSGVVCSVSETFHYVGLFKKKDKSSMAWNVILDIGPDIKIPVSGYVKIRQAKPETWKQMCASADEGFVKREVSYHKNDENQTSVEREDTVPAYKYGSTLVPFTAEDNEYLSYDSGQKCFSVLGFVDRKTVPVHLYIGDGTMHFVARKEDEHAEVALSAIVNALYLMDRVALVRRVYSARSAVRLGVLMPRITAKHEGLTYVELPFAEDVRQYLFAPVATGKSTPNDEQLEAVDSLITCMDLGKAARDEDGNEVEAMKSTKLLNPFLQHLQYCMSQRSMQDQVLKLPPVLKRVEAILEPPCPNRKRRAELLDEIDKLFKTEEVPVKASRQFASRDAAVTNNTDMPLAPQDNQPGANGDDLVDMTSDAVTEVGTTDPVQDFRQLVEAARGDVTMINSFCNQLRDVISKLLMSSGSVQFVAKCVACLKELRKAKIQLKKALDYNNFLVDLKAVLNEKTRDRFLTVLKEEEAGLIQTAECSSVQVSADDAEQFFRAGQLGQGSTASGAAGNINNTDGDDDEFDADALLDDM